MFCIGGKSRGKKTRKSKVSQNLVTTRILVFQISLGKKFPRNPQHQNPEDIREICGVNEKMKKKF